MLKVKRKHEIPSHDKLGQILAFPLPPPTPPPQWPNLNAKKHFNISSVKVALDIIIRTSNDSIRPWWLSGITNSKFK